MDSGFKVRPAAGIKLKRLFYNCFEWDTHLSIDNSLTSLPTCRNMIIFVPKSVMEVKLSRRELCRIFKFQNLFVCVCVCARLCVLVCFLLSVWHFVLF